MRCEQRNVSKVSMGEPNKLQVGAAQARSAGAGRGVQSTEVWWVLPCLALLRPI